MSQVRRDELGEERKLFGKGLKSTLANQIADGDLSTWGKIVFFQFSGIIKRKSGGWAVVARTWEAEAGKSL